MYGAALASVALLSVLIQGFDLWSLTLVTSVVTSIVVFALLTRYDSRTFFAPGAIAVCVTALALWLVASAQLSSVVAAARLGLAQQLLMPLAFAAFALAPRHGPAWRAVTAAGALLCGVLAFAVLIEPFIFERPTFSAFFVQRNSLSGYLLLVALMLVPGFAGIGEASRPRRASWWCIPVFLALLIVCFSASRGAIGAMFIGVAGLYLTMSRRERDGVGKLLVALALWAFLLADLGMKGGVFDSVASMRTVSRDLFLPGLSAIGAGDDSALRHYALRESRSLSDSKLTSANERLLIWSSTIGMVRDAPWHGYGPGTFRLVYPAYALPEDRSSLTYAHNDYLQIAAELGVPGVVIVAALGIGIAWRWRSFRRRREPESLEANALFWAMVATAAHSVFTYNFYVPATLVMFGLVLARFDAITSTRVEHGWHISPPSRYIGRRLFIAVTAVAALSVVVPTAAAALMARDYEHGVLALADGRLEDARRLFARAAILSPSARVAVAQAYLYLAAYDASGDRGLIDIAAERVRAASDTDPYSPVVPHARMLVALRQPDTPENSATIAAAYRETIRRDSRYFPVRLDLAKHLRQRGHAREARAVLEQGLRYPVADHPLVMDYLQMLAELRRTDGEEAGARRAERESRRLELRLDKPL